MTRKNRNAHDILPIKECWDPIEAKCNKQIHPNNAALFALHLVQSFGQTSVTRLQSLSIGFQIELRYRCWRMRFCFTWDEICLGSLFFSIRTCLLFKHRHSHSHCFIHLSKSSSTASIHHSIDTTNHQILPQLEAGFP